MNTRSVIRVYVCITRVCMYYACVCITRVCVRGERTATCGGRDGTGRDDDGNRAVHAVRRCGDVAFEDVVFAVLRSRRRGETVVRSFGLAAWFSNPTRLRTLRALYVFLTHSLSPFYLTLSVPPSLFRFFFYGVVGTRAPMFRTRFILVFV